MPSRRIVSRIHRSWFARTPSRYAEANAGSASRTSGCSDSGGYRHSSRPRSTTSGYCSSGRNRSVSRLVNGPRWSRRQAWNSSQNSSSEASGRRSRIAANRPS